MFKQSKWMLWCAVIVLTFVSFSQTQANETGPTVSGAHLDRALPVAPQGSDEAHSEESTIYGGGRDRTNLIEEIVVVGNTKEQRQNLDRTLNTRPAIEKPSRVDLRFLPVYDPEETNPHFGLEQDDERAGRVGIVTLFRISF